MDQKVGGIKGLIMAKPKNIWAYKIWLKEYQRIYKNKLGVYMPDNETIQAFFQDDYSPEDAVNEEFSTWDR